MKTIVPLKYISIFILIILTHSSLFSQKNDVPIIEKEFCAGKNLVNGKPISAKEFQFPCRVYSFFPDTNNQKIIFVLRYLRKNGKHYKNEGIFMRYDIEKKQILWSKKITSFNFFKNKGILFDYANGQYHRINPETGYYVSQTDKQLFYIDEKKEIGLGYNLMRMNKKLKALDLKTGRELWERKINPEYGWNDGLRLNDSTFIISCSGLHCVNLKNGKGWDYYAVTGANDYTGAIAANAAGIALGLLTGMFVMSTGHNVISNLASNICADKGLLYFASKDKIACIDYNGKEKWVNSLPEKLTGKSYIRIVNNKLILINTGSANFNSREIGYGNFYISAYELNSGKQIFISLYKEQKLQSSEHLIKNDTCYACFPDRIIKYSLTDGKPISSKLVKKNEKQIISGFAGNQVYIKNADASFSSLALSDTSKIYVYTSDRNILVMNHNLSIEKTLDSSEVYINYLTDKSCKAISKSNNTLILNNSNKSIASLNLTGSCFIFGNKLYAIRNDNFIEIDLNDINL